MATDFLWGNLITVANQRSFNVNPDVAAIGDCQLPAIQPETARQS